METFVINEIKSACNTQRGVQAKLAKHFGVEAGTISNRINGTRNSDETFRRTAASFAGLDYDDLVREFYYMYPDKEQNEASNSITASNGSTVVTAGRDAVNTSGEGGTLQLSQLEREIIRKNRKYGNEQVLQRLSDKLDKLREITEDF